MKSLETKKPIEFASAFDNAQQALALRFSNPFYQLTELFNPSIKKDVKLLRKFGLDIIAARKSSTESKQDLLQLFMDHKDEDGVLTDDMLCDQIINFIMAGRDTT